MANINTIHQFVRTSSIVGGVLSTTNSGDCNAFLTVTRRDIAWPFSQTKAVCTFSMVDVKTRS